MKFILAKFIFILCSIILANTLQAQSGEMLKQQYRKGPTFSKDYRKWNFEVGAFASYVNGTSGSTSPTLGYVGGIKSQLQISRTIGFALGASYQETGYRYVSLEGEKFKDKITYITIPLTLRVFPFKKFFLEIGPQYNLLIDAKRIDSQKVSLSYAEGIFEDSFGFILGIHYNVWHRFNVAAQYRFSKGHSNPYTIQTNNHLGYYLGINFHVLRRDTK